MIKTREELKKFLAVELPRYKTNFLCYFLQVSEKDIIRRYLTILRKTEFYKNTNKKIRFFAYKAKLLKISNKYSIHIPINTCDIGLHIMHVGPILVNGGARIGKNAALHINTAIVAGGRTDKAPIIGDNVVIGVGAVVVGDIRVADNVAIGANAVVNKDVLEDNIAVAGVPAKKISNNGSSTWNPNKIKNNEGV